MHKVIGSNISRIDYELLFEISVSPPYCDKIRPMDWWLILYTFFSFTAQVLNFCVSVQRYKRIQWEYEPVISKSLSEWQLFEFFAAADSLCVAVSLNNRSYISHVFPIIGSLHNSFRIEWTLIRNDYLSGINDLYYLTWYLIDDISWYLILRWFDPDIIFSLLFERVSLHQEF